MKEKLKAPELRFDGFTDDWEERKLGDVGNTFTGLTGKTKEDFGHGSAKFVTYVNVFQNPIATLDQLDAIEIDEKQNQVQKGDIFFTTSSETPEEVGMSSVWTHDTENVYLNSFTFGYRPRVSFDLNYMASMLRSPSIRKKITFLAQGISRYNISKTKMLEIEIPTPTLSEQEKIGSFFKQLDNTIALHQRKLDLLKEQKKGYLQKMFPKNGAKVPELRFAGFADDWEERKLIDVKDNEDRYSYTGGPFGSDLKSSDYTEIGVRIIQLQNIGDGKFVNDYKIYTSEEKARSLNSNLIYPGEIIIAKMADPLARATILPKIEPKYLMASDGIRLKISTDYFDNYYILTLINSDVFRKEALNNSTGTTRKRIGLVTLGNLPMMIPSFEEQQKIGSFFKQLDETIALHQRKLDLLKEQKKGFLQKMFV
ncbi:restriction endonuclease subunit S [Lactococcus lactis]|uniref:restriction endonuclease subunit S n=1 Tax=Lactococcus lactis TaxID=1358 RepID=UPI00288E7E30|nr:restriction endonuclease subunit S [Lactococcus lactis]MDT2876481.1 restriction endonuclease subunit S [Lactococcus lactis]